MVLSGLESGSLTFNSHVDIHSKSVVESMVIFRIIFMDNTMFPADDMNSIQIPICFHLMTSSHKARFLGANAIFNYHGVAFPGLVQEFKSTHPFPLQMNRHGSHMCLAPPYLSLCAPCDFVSSSMQQAAAEVSIAMRQRRGC